MRLSFSLLVGALIAGVSASNVQDLTPDNFDSVVGQGVPAFVEFFAPWCGHCKNLAPVWEQLANVFEHAKDKVVIAKVDADGAGRPLGERYGVTGFPTLKFFDAKGVESKYEEGRDLETLAAYITKQTGVKSKLPTTPPSFVKKIDVSNFNDVVLDSTKNVFITYTAPWCGHCKNLKPTWEKLAQWFVPESNCIVANINADDEKNKPLAKQEGVSSYPTIKFYGHDNKAEEYSGGRSEADLVKFLNKKCGTFRAVGGGLNSKAGLVPELDAIATQFVAASKDARQKLLDEASALASKAGAAGKHYIRAMEKVVTGTEGYIEKEAKRLGSILAKRNLSDKKLDELKVKANILKSFTDKPKEKKEDETVAREKAEL
ncbi:hypothetical protein EST38_g314 [Candolleomyces aberdarensis]|uniref:protein disulfide-isomerase n=1 Tax=Candolleomyces aberdarensis TaxID=2316362 RepID=A0A4Q2E299_9AGAR|nr:hypothetical protein EST38_g314 [Candolleomyces aberdarensis]